MVFSSLQFIFIFLPIMLFFYLACPKRHKNVVLFLGSVIFYGIGTLDTPSYLFLILGSVVLNYFFGIAISMAHKKARKPIFIAGLILNFSALVFFKYTGFLFENFNNFIHTLLPSVEWGLPDMHLILPIGISFYTFQAVSYLFDVYRKRIAVCTSFINLGTYICMFPQLIAGPIVTYTTVEKQLQKRPEITFAILQEGLITFVYGLAMKVLLANRIGSLWSEIQTIGFESISTPMAWLGAVAFSFQLYFDFYGYSLMAVGLGKMFAFDLPLNFNHPYCATSMTEFWRRWHITLGSWFREYVYIPLGGNKKGKYRTILNLLVVWCLTGIWHGASWNFLLWGFVLFLVIAVEKLWLLSILKRLPMLGSLYMLFLIPVTWMLFAITDFSQLLTYFGRMFGLSSDALVIQGDVAMYASQYGWLLAACVIFSTPVPAWLLSRIKNHIIGVVLLLAAFWFSIYYLFLGLNDPFLYFRF